jgi:hypothetical protein
MAGEGVAGSHAIPVQPPGERDALIRAAITGRRPMAVIYDGRERLFCPYMLGRNKEGHWRLLVYQYGGQSGGGLQRKDGRRDWRCFSVEKIGAARILDAAWQAAETHSRRPKCIDRIELQVEDWKDQPEVILNRGLSPKAPRSKGNGEAAEAGIAPA